MAMVSPSILSADFVNLERDLRAIAGPAQITFM